MMFPMKRIWFILLGLLASTPLLSQVPSRADIDLRRDWLHQTSLLRLDELVQCHILRQQGDDSGRITFQQEAPTCALLYIKGTYLSLALEDVRLFQPLPERGFAEACYQSGWLTGYLVAYGSLGPTCEDQLTAEAHLSLTRRIQECEALGDVIAADSISLADFIRQHVESQSRDEASRLLEDMVSLVQIGRSGAAWDLMVKSQKSELFGSLPCQAAIAMKLRQ